MKVNEGIVRLEVNGVVNIQEIKANLSANLDKYRDIIWTEETRKDIQEVIKELKPERTKIKKIAATFNKQGKEVIKTKYDEIKSIERLLDEVINPLEQGEKDYIEKVRLANMEKKKAIFADQIAEINKIIEDQNKYFKYTLHEPIQFLDDWGKKSENSIKLELEKIVSDIEKKRTEIINLKDGVMTAAELFKNQYELKSSLNYELILGDRIYTDTLQECKVILEKFAADQQAKEIEAEELAKEEAERKARLEKEKAEAEQKKKEQEAARKHQEELKAAQEKAAAEERARIEKERLQEEERKKAIIENDRKLREQEEKKKSQDKSGEKLVTRDYTMKFTVNKDQATKLFQFMIDNDIKYEKIDEKNK